jgi:hypothetical protein
VTSDLHPFASVQPSEFPTDVAAPLRLYTGFIVSWFLNANGYIAEFHLMCAHMVTAVNRVQYIYAESSLTSRPGDVKTGDTFVLTLLRLIDPAKRASVSLVLCNSFI